MQDLPRSSEQPSTPFPDEQKDYLETYFGGTSAIQAWDAAHGIRLEQGADGMYRFSISRTDFNALCGDVGDAGALFPEYFANRSFRSFSLDMYTPTGRQIASEALRASISYVENFDRLREQSGGIGLYLVSRTRGSGKTFLSTIIGSELSRRHKKVLWYSMVNLLGELKASYDRESGYSSTEIISKAKSAPVLILDDVGAEKQSGWVDEILYQIIDERVLHGRPTIYTGNCQIADLKYDERVKSRIDRSALVLPMPEESVRAMLAKRDQLRMRGALGL